MGPSSLRRMRSKGRGVRLTLALAVVLFIATVLSHGFFLSTESTIWDCWQMLDRMKMPATVILGLN